MRSVLSANLTHYVSSFKTYTPHINHLRKDLMSNSKLFFRIDLPRWVVVEITLLDLSYQYPFKFYK